MIRSHARRLFRGLFEPAPVLHKIVRIGVVGPPTTGKTFLMKHITEDAHALDFGIAVHFGSTIHRLPKQPGPTGQYTVELAAQVFPEAHGAVDVHFVDTMGGEVLSPTPSEEFLDAMRCLDLLVIALDPETLYGPDVERRLMMLGERARLVLRNRPCASIALVYTKCDEYALPYDRMGRLLTTDHAPSMAALRRTLNRRGTRGSTERVLEAMALQRRFPEPDQHAIVEDLVRRSAPLWVQVGCADADVPWQLNGYLTAGVPGLARGERALQHGVGFDQCLRDFFGRVHQPWWPFWQEDAEAA